MQPGFAAASAPGWADVQPSRSPPENLSAYPVGYLSRARRIGLRLLLRLRSGLLWLLLLLPLLLGLLLLGGLVAAGVVVTPQPARPIVHTSRQSGIFRAFDTR